MDYYTMLAGIAAGGVGGLISGTIVGLVWGWLRGLQLDSVEARLNRHIGAERGQAGLERQQEKNDRMMQAIGEALNALQSGEDPKKALLEIAKRYPDIAFELAKTVGFKMPNAKG